MNKPAFKILSIDGGGIRGIISCKILEFIENEIGNLHETFDLMVGTSTGGIITLGLAAPGEDKESCAFDAKALANIYEHHGKDIFGKRKGNFILRRIPFIKPYRSVGLNNLLNQKFGRRELKSCLTDVLVTSYDLKKGRPFYFSSRLARERDEENFSLKSIARSTSAAPIYFEPSLVQIREAEDLALVDGGILANNPSILAYIEGKELYKRMPDKVHSPVHSKSTSKDVTPSNDDLPFFMLSIGTGTHNKSYSYKKMSRGTNRKWVIPLISDIFMRSVSENTHYVMHHLLPPYEYDKTKEKFSPKHSRYWRIDIDILEKNSKMDKVSKKNINALKDAADKYIEENQKELLEICDILR